GARDPALAANLVARLAGQDLPGNVRELRAAVERTVLLGDAEMCGELTESRWAADRNRGGGSALPLRFDPATPFRVAKHNLVSSWERWYLRELLHHNEGILSRAARAARMDRTYLRERLRRY